MIVKSDAIILRSIKFRDTSKIITCYSKEFGQIKLLAKGARSQKSKFGASLEPITESHIVFYKKEGKDLNLLSKCEIINSINPFLKNYEILVEALSIIEIFYRSHHHEEKNVKAYFLISETLKAISQSNPNITQIIICFYLNLSKLFGVSLTLDHCHECKLDYKIEKNITTNYLIKSNGTLICENCYNLKSTLSSFKIGKNLLQELILISNLNPQEVIKINFPNLEFNELRNVLFEYITLHIEGIKNIQSQKIF
ncbi:MAG: DNA repair protein RecO [Bacteroidetes bacterium]|nr:DNA repair protein RecO [Bacteroidota bacterium]